MKLNSTYLVPAITLFSGVALSLLASRSLEVEPEKANPLAIRKSGYGMTLARLSQDTVNRVWHIGIEEVDPHDHDEKCDCSHCSDDHEELKRHGHEEPDHSQCSHCSHVQEESHGHDHAEQEHSQCSHCSDDHEEHLGHGHEEGKSGHPSLGVVERAHNHLEELQQAKNRRTSKYSLTDRHKLTTSKQIENTLRKSYGMDPTNYGVYSAYYLFLTIHDLGATEKAKQRAEVISHQTIREAFQEKEHPEAYLTAATAALNLFFIEQARLKKKGELFSRWELVDHQKLINRCLGNFDRIKQQREIEGSWEQIPVARRDEIVERARFARKTQEQFGAMLARMENSKPSGPATSFVKNKSTETKSGSNE